jgi:hypothetical protein
MRRLEFRLSMPNRGSWNGGWSGAERRYSIVKSLPDRRVLALLGGKDRGSWGYNFGDGWFASVEARVVPKGERLPKSDGFCGYDWMVVSILADGDIYGPMQPRPEADHG